MNLSRVSQFNPTGPSAGDAMPSLQRVTSFHPSRFSFPVSASPWDRWPPREQGVIPQRGIHVLAGNQPPRRSRLAFLLPLLLLLALSPAHAAEIQVRASLSDTSTAAGSPVTLSLEIQNARGAEVPDRIDVPGLNIFRTGQSTNVSIINMQMTSTTTYSYQVVPSKEGAFTIPPIKVKAEGKIFNTAPLQINVGPAARPPTAGRSNTPREDSKISVSAELVIPKRTAYVGEPIPAEIRIYVPGNVRAQLQGPPTLAAPGFTVAPFPNPKTLTQNVDGREFNVIVFRTALTPVKAGTLPAGPAEAQVLVQTRRRMPRPQGGLFDDEFFNDAFGMVEQRELRAQTDTPSLEIKPLPAEGRPANFSGAVGNFQITAEASPKRGNVGDPITLKVQVSGRGDFDRVQLPTVTDDTGWKSYPPSSKFQANDDLGLSGDKTFEVILIPSKATKATPPIAFSYFDPTREKYVTVPIPSQPVEITGAAIAPTPPPALPSTKRDETETPRTDDILHILPNPGKPGGTFVPIWYEKSFWYAQGIPLALWLGTLAFAGLKRSSRNPEARKRHQLLQKRDTLIRQLRSGRTLAPEKTVRTAAELFALEAALRTGRDPATLTSDATLAAFSESDRAQIAPILAANEKLLYGSGGPASASSSIEPEIIHATIQSIFSK